MSAPHPLLTLRTAAVWGTTVLSTKALFSGQSLRLGDGGEALVAKPEGAPISDLPIRAVGAGWELDARGATGGEVFLRGRKEDPAELAKSGAPIPIVAGDYGLVQYGNFGVFFQFSDAVPVLAKRRRVDWGLFFSFVFAVIAVGGALALIWAITTPRGIPKPLELTSQAELAVQMNLKLEDLEPPPTAGQKEEDKGKGVEDPGAKDQKAQGGGKKVRGAEGKLGKNTDADQNQMTGEPAASLGGMAEALSSDVGEEVKKTLGTISSVADALGGLRSDSIVLGQGSGTGLRGSGAAGGGTEEGGVPFGSGTLDTGWGAGRSGGFGAGTGGPGARGLGGNGRGGPGGGQGSGAGDGERKLAGKDAAPAGQGLSAEQVRRVVMSRLGSFQACMDLDPAAKGSLSVSFGISPSGSVTRASVGSSSLKNPRIEGCMVRVFNRLKFPAADKATNSVWPFVAKGQSKR